MTKRCDRCPNYVCGAYRVRDGEVSCAACEPDLDDGDSLSPAEWEARAERFEGYRSRKAAFVEVGDVIRGEA